MSLFSIKKDAPFEKASFSKIAGEGLEPPAFGL